MGIRDFVDGQLGALLNFGRVNATAVLDRAKSVVATLVGSEDPEGDEELEGCELWGHAPLGYRPKGPTAAGECEALFFRYGDDRVVIATKDRRYQVQLAEGEVTLSALAQDGAAHARIRLKPDGQVIVDGTRIEACGASDLALANAVMNHLTKISADLTTVFAAATAGTPTYIYATEIVANPIRTVKTKGE